MLHTHTTAGENVSLLTSSARLLSAVSLVLLTACGGEPNVGATTVDLGEPISDDLPLGAFSFPVNELDYNFDQAHQMQYWSATTISDSAFDLRFEWQQDTGRPDASRVDDKGSAVISPAWLSENDRFVLETSFTADVLGPPELETDQADLSCGSLRYSMYVPEAYRDSVNGLLSFRFFLQDIDGNKALLPEYVTNAIDDFAATNSNALGWYDFSYTTLTNESFAAEVGFDLSRVNHMGVEFDANGKPTDVIGDLRLDNILLTPAVIKDCEGDFTINDIVVDTFDEASDVDAWGEDYMEGSFAYTVSHSVDGGEPGGAMLFEFAWADAGSDKLLWARSLSEPIDLTNRNLSVDLNLSQAYVDDGNFLIKVFVKDSAFRYRNFGDISASGLVAGYNELAVSDITSDTQGFVADGFDLTQVTAIGIEFVANGKPNNINDDVLVDNYRIFEIVEGSGGGELTAAVQFDFDSDNQLEPWGVDWVGGELSEENVSVMQVSDQGSSAMAFDVTWNSSSDELGWSTAIETLDLTGAIVRVDIYMPAAYVNDGNLGMKIFTKDASFVYGSLGWLSSSGFNGDAWNTVEVLVEDLGAFDFSGAGYDITSVETLGIQIVANGKASDIDGVIQVDNLEILLPATVAENVVGFDFSDASQFILP